jgi:5-methylcytosine-specific restriction endonuclease McrA
MRSSPGTVIPWHIRKAVLERDQGCVGLRAGMLHSCSGNIELDHVRASHGMGMKSESTAENLVSLCGVAHRQKTEAGKIWRPKLLAYLAGVAQETGRTGT